MAFTPYPHGTPPLENPSIVVSQNGIKWEVPDGLTNPLVEKPEPRGYNSDPHIFYNENTEKLEVWYREVTGTSPTETETIIRLTSSDGITWSQPEAMLSETTDDRPFNLISPSVIFDQGIYKMWFMKNHYLYYMTSSDGKNWSDPVDVRANGKRVVTWHTNVVLHEGTYHMLNFVHSRIIRYSYAEVGSETEFSEEVQIIKNTGSEWELDGRGFYRASAIFTGTNVIVIYGTISHQNDWLLHAVSGLDFYNLKPITQRAFDFYGID